MKARDTVILGLKIVLLAFLLYTCYLIASSLVGLTGSAQATDQMQEAVALVVVCLLDSIVLSYPTIRSQWTGGKLVATIFLVFYGVMTFLSQIETVVFLQYFEHIVPVELTPSLFLHGLITAALFAPLVVLIHGKTRRSDESKPNPRLVMPLREWVWKLVLIAAVYVVIYVAFGAFIAQPLGGEAFQEYYANLQLPAWILPFQLIRGLIWAALAIPVVKMMKGFWWEAGFAVALLFSVLMGSLLLIPNPYMPDVIRVAHLVEIMSSNFLFGWIAVRVLHIRKRILPV